MFQSLKLWKLASALKNPGAGQEAYAAVLELGRIGNAKAVQLLIDSLARGDGVSRSAARELGRLGDTRAIGPLTALLGNAEVNQSAAEALVKLGAVDALLTALQAEEPAVRKIAAAALGEMGNARAVQPLIGLLQTDNEYSVRTAAATSLGQLKDSRAIWVLVGTLKLRDETTPERQTALEQLRQAATLAMRKIGDPLAARPAPEAIDKPPMAKAADETNTADAHPRLSGDLGRCSDAEFVSVLKELIAASEEISWANLEKREPMLPAYFQSYEQRRRTAEVIGAELQRRGGTALLKRVLEQDLGGYAAISNWWSGLDPAAE